MVEIMPKNILPFCSLAGIIILQSEQSRMDLKRLNHLPGFLKVKTRPTTGAAGGRGRIGSAAAPFQARLIVFTALALALLFLSGVLNLALYHRHKEASDRLQEALIWALEENSALKDELESVTGQLEELQEQYELLLQDKQRDGNRDNPGGSYPPTAYLTFDDGPSKITLEILDILAEHQIQATFFVLGYNNSEDEQIYNRILAEGHALGNHTYTHKLKVIYRSADHFMADLLRLEEHLYQQTGARPEIMRFPGGSSNTVASTALMRELIAAVREHGYDYFDWNISSGDSDSSLPASRLVDNVTTQVDRAGGRDIVVLMHDTYLSYATAEALPQIIAELQDRGYCFAPLSKGAINMKHRQ